MSTTELDQLKEISEVDIDMANWLGKVDRHVTK
jgi:hypothetical protein